MPGDGSATDRLAAAFLEYAKETGQTGVSIAVRTVAEWARQAETNAPRLRVVSPVPATGEPFPWPRAPRGLSLWDRAMWYVSPCPITGCWWWMGSLDPDGYAQMSVRKAGGVKTHKIHRLLFALKHGLPLSTESVIRHQCPHRSCVNPAHMLVGSQGENVRDSVLAGRQGASRELVARIVELHRKGLPRRRIARVLGVSPASVRYHLFGRSVHGRELRSK